MYKKKKVIFLVLALVFIMNILYVYGETVDELRDKQKDINKQVTETKNEMKSLEAQTKNITKEIADLDKKIDSASIELDQVEKEIENLEILIDTTLDELDKANDNLEEKQEVFSKRLRVMYKTGNVGYLEVLLSSADIKDFLTRSDMLKSIAKHDTDLIKFMKDQRDTIELKKAELEMQKKSVELSKSKLEVRKRDFEKVSREKESYIVKLEQDLKAYEAQIDKLNEESKVVEAEIIKRTKNTGPYEGGQMTWPAPGNNNISSPFGYRIHPILKTKKLHTGIDIPAATGSKIVAGAAGTVIYSGSLGGYGKTIMLDHGGGIVTLYAHNSSLLVNEGQVVQRGEQVAKAGSTGLSTGPHCHFEVRKDGAYIDPMPYLKGN